MLFTFRQSTNSVNLKRLLSPKQRSRLTLLTAIRSRNMSESNDEEVKSDITKRIDKYRSMNYWEMPLGIKPKPILGLKFVFMDAIYNRYWHFMQIAPYIEPKLLLEAFQAKDEALYRLENDIIK